MIIGTLGVQTVESQKMATEARRWPSISALTSQAAAPLFGWRLECMAGGRNRSQRAGKAPHIRTHYIYDIVIFVNMVYINLYVYIYI